MAPQLRRFLLSFLLIGPAEEFPRARPFLVFFLGFVLYVSAQLGFNISVMAERTAPPEVDDAYGYMLKAVQMKECFFQGAPALNDLGRQISIPTSEHNVAWQQARQYHRLFAVYHPLHSVGMLALRSVGLSWEGAYSALTILGKTFLCLAAALWLYSIWGAGSTGVALGLLAFQTFPRQGLSYIAPTNLALGLAMATWALVLLWKGSRRADWALVIGVIAMTAMHPLGRIYAVIAVGLYLAISAWPWPRKTWLLCGVVIVLIAATFALPHVVSRPALATVHFPAREGWDYWQGMRENLEVARAQARNWVNSYECGYPGFIFLLALGFILGSPARLLFAIGGLLTALLIVSVAYALPVYKGVMFLRNWIPMAIFLTGALGRLGYLWLAGAVSLWRRHSGGGADAAALANRVIPALRVIVFAVIGVLFWRAALAHGTNSLARFRDKRERVIARHNNMNLDPAQPAMLLRRAQAGDSVLYTHEVPFYFFLCHGANRLGAVYAPLVAGTSEEKAWIEENEAIRYLVSLTPVACARNPITRQGQGGLVLNPTKKLEIRSAAASPISSLFLHIENPGPEAALRITFRDGEKSNHLLLQIPAGYSGWMPVGARGHRAAADLLIERIDGGAPIRLKGVRLDRESSLNWPWDEGVSLHLPPDKGIPEETIHFDSAGLYPRLGRPLRVVDDSGSTVLAEVTRFAYARRD